MTENETKVTAEAVYGRELLDEVAALTWGLTARKEDLQDFTARARRAVRARGEAEDRMGGQVELHDDLGPESGLEAFADLASDVGLFDEIFEHRTTSATLDDPGHLPSLSPWSAPGAVASPRPGSMRWSTP